jgi:hypothetical protein
MLSVPSALLIFLSSNTHLYAIMDFLKRVLSSFGRQNYRRPNALEFSPFAKLPPELILSIAAFLPPITTACFSLYCTPIYLLLASKGQKTLRENWEFDYSSDFLARLEQDLPNHIACESCKKFHAIKHVKSHIESKHYNSSRSISISWCWETDRKFNTMHYIHPGFSFTVFQMAMKLYRQRADCSYLLDLLSLKTRTVYNRGDIEHVTALSRIFHGWLLVRKHSLFPVHPPKDSPSNDSYSPHARFFVCPHLGEASWKLLDRGRVSSNGNCRSGMQSKLLYK